MTFEEADMLFDEVAGFLMSCGGIYQHLTVETQENIMFCICTGQFILYRDTTGAMLHFICYWKIAPEDVELLANGVSPANRVRGSVLYVVEHGNKAGKASMWAAIRELRKRCKGMQGLVFNHKGEGVKHFPCQKGA